MKTPTRSTNCHFGLHLLVLSRRVRLLAPMRLLDAITERLAALISSVALVQPEERDRDAASSPTLTLIVPFQM